MTGPEFLAGVAAGAAGAGAAALIRRQQPIRRLVAAKRHLFPVTRFMHVRCGHGRDARSLAQLLEQIRGEGRILVLTGIGLYSGSRAVQDILVYCEDRSLVTVIDLHYDLQPMIMPPPEALSLMLALMDRSASAIVCLSTPLDRAASDRVNWERLRATISRNLSPGLSDAVIVELGRYLTPARIGAVVGIDEVQPPFDDRDGDEPGEHGGF